MCKNCSDGAGPHIPGLPTRREILAQMGVMGALAAGTMIGGNAFAQGGGSSPSPAVGYAQMSAGRPFERYAFERRAVNAGDVLVDILYSGICHTDIHTSNGDFGAPAFPLMPGHEIVGRVAAVGNGVTKFKVGDSVGVGCMVDSCGECEFCLAGEEQYCVEGNVQTYGLHRPSGMNLLGGYSNKIVVREAFAIKIPETMDLARTAPLLCAGITTFSPMELWDIGEGDNVAVVGLGGLGHIAVKLAIARGATVTVMTTTAAKTDDAMDLGATQVVVWPDEAAFAELKSSFDSIVTTVPYGFDANPFLTLLKTDGVMINVGLLGPFSAPINNVWLAAGRRTLTSSAIGGVAETQKVIDFCADRNIAADIELIGIDQVNEAYARVIDKDVRYRFVIDMSSLT